jgi:hypothetical protein
MGTATGSVDTWLISEVRLIAKLVWCSWFVILGHFSLLLTSSL